MKTLWIVDPCLTCRNGYFLVFQISFSFLIYSQIWISKDNKNVKKRKINGENSSKKLANIKYELSQSMRHKTGKSILFQILNSKNYAS